MQSKKIAVLFVACLIIIGIKIPQTHAQSPKDGQIPSDLVLDLELAQKNPTPEQKLISEVQTEKAQMITKTGEKLDLPIKEAIPEEIKTQSAKDAVNPDQTTSEQVIEKKETGPQESNGSNNNVDNGVVQNNIPGTNLAEPDDNNAPKPANPAPAASGADDTSAPPVSTTPPASEPATTIPLENGNPQPQPTNQPETAPAGNPPAQSSDTAPSSDNSSSQSSGGDSGGSDTGSGVQGVSTVSFWQLFLNKLAEVFKK